MVTISSEAMRNIAGAKWYFTQNHKKRAEHREYVSISATNGAMVSTFFDQLLANHERWGKAGYVPAFTRDENGARIPKLDKQGHRIYEAQYVQFYSLVQGFGPDELDPEDPASWDRAQELGRAVARELSRQAATAKVVNGEVVDDPAKAGFSAEGHMALVVTEIGGNGRLHNHILVDAVNRFTGASMNSSFVSHHRVAKTHDRLLEARGFQQREDMLQIAAEVLAKQQAGENGHSYRRTAQQQRETPEVVEARQSLRHEQWSVEAAIARAGGEPIPTEPFDPDALRERARAALADARATSWDELQRIAREHHVTVSRRGSDVTYGMMREQPDGSFAEPAKSDHRRGSKLAPDLSVESAEQLLAENDARARELAAAQAKHALEDSRLAEPTVQQMPSARELAGVQAPQLTPELRQRVDALVTLDAQYLGRAPDASFEEQVQQLGVDESFLAEHGDLLGSDMRQHLESRQARIRDEQSAHARALEHHARSTELHEKYTRIAEDGQQRDPMGWRYTNQAQQMLDQLATSNAAIERENARVQALREQRARGDYADHSRERDLSPAERAQRAVERARDRQRTLEDRDYGHDL